MRLHCILYVADQARSAAFYAAVLARAPALDVPGMTEFQIGQGAVLGLMPVTGIERLLGVPALLTDQRALRAEVYLVVDEPALYHARALAAGALELSPLLPRDWGDEAAYVRDADGYVVAFARASAGP